MATKTLIVLLFLVESSLTVELAVPKFNYELPQILKSEKTDREIDGSPTDMNQQWTKKALHVPVLKTLFEATKDENQLNVPRYILSPQDSQPEAALISLPRLLYGNDALLPPKEDRFQVPGSIPSGKVQLDDLPADLNVPYGKDALVHLREEEVDQLQLTALSPAISSGLGWDGKPEYQVPKYPSLDGSNQFVDQSSDESFNVPQETIPAGDSNTDFDLSSDGSLESSWGPSYSESESASEIESSLDSESSLVYKSSLGLLSTLGKLEVPGSDDIVRSDPGGSSDSSAIDWDSDSSSIGWASDESGSDSNELDWGEFDNWGETNPGRRLLSFKGLHSEKVKGHSRIGKLIEQWAKHKKVKRAVDVVSVETSGISSNTAASGDDSFLYSSSDGYPSESEEREEDGIMENVINWVASKSKHVGIGQGNRMDDGQAVEGSGDQDYESLSVQDSLYSSSDSYESSNEGSQDDVGSGDHESIAYYASDSESYDSSYEGSGDPDDSTHGSLAFRVNSFDHSESGSDDSTSGDSSYGVESDSEALISIFNLSGVGKTAADNGQDDQGDELDAMWGDIFSSASDAASDYSESSDSLPYDSSSDSLSLDSSDVFGSLLDGFFDTNLKDTFPVDKQEDRSEDTLPVLTDLWGSTFRGSGSSSDSYDSYSGGDSLDDSAVGSDSDSGYSSDDSVVSSAESLDSYDYESLESDTSDFPLPFSIADVSSDLDYSDESSSSDYESSESDTSDFPLPFSSADVSSDLDYSDESSSSDYESSETDTSAFPLPFSIGDGSFELGYSDESSAFPLILGIDSVDTPSYDSSSIDSSNVPSDNSYLIGDPVQPDEDQSSSSEGRSTFSDYSSDVASSSGSDAVGRTSVFVVPMGDHPAKSKESGSGASDDLPPSDLPPNELLHYNDVEQDRYQEPGWDKVKVGGGRLSWRILNRLANPTTPDSSQNDGGMDDSSQLLQDIFRDSPTPGDMRLKVATDQNGLHHVPHFSNDGAHLNEADGVESNEEVPAIPGTPKSQTRLQSMDKDDNDVDIIGGKSLILYSVPLVLLLVLIFLVWSNRYFHRTPRVVAVDPEARIHDYNVINKETKEVEPLLREEMTYRDDIY